MKCAENHQRVVISIPAETRGQRSGAHGVLLLRLRGWSGEDTDVINSWVTASWEWLQAVRRTGPEFKIPLTMVGALGNQ